jgi:hypothetical protein
MGQKVFAFLETKATTLAFAKTELTTPQNTNRPNHHNNSSVVLFGIVQYTLHIKFCKVYNWPNHHNNSSVVLFGIVQYTLDTKFCKV